MGHDITLVNKAGEKIGYVRFSAGDFKSYYFYELFGAQDFNGIVSGLGRRKDYGVAKMKRAYEKYLELEERHFVYPGNDFGKNQEESIVSFLKNGITSAEKEGTVTIYYE